MRRPGSRLRTMAARFCRASVENLMHAGRKWAELQVKDGGFQIRLSMRKAV
jgi:hypothetical protein